MGRLELKTEGDSLCHLLEGKPIHPGQDLEILLEGGLWVVGRYEWTGEQTRRPTLHLCCGGPWEEADVETDTLPIPPEVSFPIPHEALLRLPQS